MQLLDTAVGPDERQRVRAEVDLVIQGNAQACVESAQRAGKPRGGDLPVDEVEGGGGGGEEEEAAGPLGGAAEGAGGARGAERGRVRRAVGGGEGPSGAGGAQGAVGRRLATEEGDGRGEARRAVSGAARGGGEAQRPRVPMKAAGYVLAQHSRLA